MFRKKQTPPPAATPSGMEELNTRDEALFNALNKSRKDKKRKRIVTVLIILAILATVLVVGVSILRKQVREQFVTSKDDVLTEQATRGTISTVVSGSGMLVNVDTEIVSVPSGVEVTEILVEYGDAVETGDLLALVDMASVRTALAELQDKIKSLDKDITAAEGDTVNTYVTAGVPGRVKRIFAEEGKRVEDIMVEHGGLAVISLDGYMAVDVETDMLQEGDAVTVVLSDGKEKEGTVKSVIAGKATVLVSDDGPAYGEEVTVKTESGDTAGIGSLYIHNPLTVTGYAGTIKTVHDKLNHSVYASTTLFVLSDTASRASYNALLRERSEQEKTLLELLKIQRSGGLAAPLSGSVYAVADLDSETDTTTEEITDIVTLSPDISMSVTISVDEADILSLQLGQEADITVRSIGDEVLSGVVTEIDKTDSSGAYKAVITLDKVAGMIPGMTASVDVRIEGVEDAILIPADALHRSSSGYYVYTSYDKETQKYGGRVEVVPGLSNSDYVEIKSGLKEGDTVCYTESQNMFGMMFGGGMPSGFGSGGGQRPSGNFGGNGGQRPSGNYGGSGGQRPSGMPGGRG